MFSITINNKDFYVHNSKTIIEITDDIGIYIPRFCYHKKLSLSANCRMCLVEIIGNEKLVPSCITPVFDGIKILTNSRRVLNAQKDIMEFLLINHPLDCPICDQGGECELQETSIGFGSSYSQYKEEKRSIRDYDLGPLISTDMTRCIYCTRCVRFGQEIYGVKELGIIGRGESVRIESFLKQNIISEISGNIIDLCPVGALTSKPFRFTARFWELQEYQGIAPHDCLGSNIYFHIYNDRLVRVIPRENNSINETWISDRDRFSYLALYNDLRMKYPMIKQNGIWKTVNWETALQFTKDGINNILDKYGTEQFASLVSPSSTLEEYYLLQKIMRKLNINNLDYRLYQNDFRDQEFKSSIPFKELKYSDLENQDVIIILGCNVYKEVPLVGTKIRKAQIKNMAKVFAINSINYDYHVDIEKNIILSPQEFPIQIAKLMLAVIKNIKVLPYQLQKILSNIYPDEISIYIAEHIKKYKSVIVTGFIFESHPDSSLLRTLIYWMSKCSNLFVLKLAIGSNNIGAYISGFLPHKTIFGKKPEKLGMDVQSILHNKLKGYLLLAVEPRFDFFNSYIANQAMLNAEFIVMFSAFNNKSIQDYANVLLPIAPYSETHGTYINIDNIWQTVQSANTPYYNSKPAWKIFCALGNLFFPDNFNYFSCAEILNEIKLIIASCNNEYIDKDCYYPDSFPVNTKDLIQINEISLYCVDMIVRHSTVFFSLKENISAKIHPLTADFLNLSDSITFYQYDINEKITIPIEKDNNVALNVIYISNSLFNFKYLGSRYSKINITT